MKKSSRDLSDMDMFLLKEKNIKVRFKRKKPSFRAREEIKRIRLEKKPSAHTMIIPEIESIEVNREKMNNLPGAIAEKYQLLLEGAQDGFWDCDLTSQAITWNSKFYEMLGLSDMAQNIPCRNLFGFLHPEDAPELVQKITTFFMSNETVYECELRLRHTSGQYRHFFCRGKVLRNELGNPERFAGAITDITHRKRAEQDLQRLNEQLKESNKDLEQFAFIASHDLRTPVRKALTFCSFLKSTRHDGLNPEALQWLSRMEICMESMQGLIDGLLSYSRVANNTIKHESVSLQTLFPSILADFEEQISELQATIEIGILPTIEADPIQMRQLFQNLISNALKFHKQERPPHIKIHSRLLPKELSGPDSGQDKPHALCQIQVEDNGIGFDEKYAHWVFLMFQRLHGHNQPEGDGIGLAICKKIVERHGGSIAVKSRVGQGSTFYIDLPVYHMTPEPVLVRQH
jgi:PAS domain S-box-containing protein